MEHGAKEKHRSFSFCDHKASYETLLSGPYGQTLVEDVADFWKFVNKCEYLLRSAGQSLNSSQPADEEQLQQLAPYHKRKHISLALLVEGGHDKYGGAGEEALRMRQFHEFLLLYLDFKQKEKFAKIKKLRRAQGALPIARFKQRIGEALSTTQVLIIAGDTGCGKSTQVPQYLYEFGYRCIACTQPRRLACVSLSKRVAQEMLQDYSSRVGFQIRFEKSRNAQTNVLFITEGLLLRQLSSSSAASLEQYDVLILDEIHERNLYGDFLLGVAKCLLRAKPQLKLILMSATINVELFQAYFAAEQAQLLEVPGRLFAIKTVFMPPPALEVCGKGGGGGKARSNSAAQRLDPAPYVKVLSLIDQKYTTQERGDVLIFVSGVNEISTLCAAINEYAQQGGDDTIGHWIVLALHSGLALAEQDRVFDYAPDGMRKCIVATNIAETSLTVDGIRFVIDSGRVKEASYDAACKGQRLKEHWVSQSSAEQRKGRAGRTGPGCCFRLFSEQQYATFAPYPTPEILRVPLDNILLQMIAMGLPNVRTFPFIEAPGEERIEQTILGLKQHALTGDERITALGKSLANLPVQISIGKMLLLGCVFPDMQKILTLAAIMSVQNPFTTRAYNDAKCEQERDALASDQGDVFTLLRAYHAWLRLKCMRDNTRKWCHRLGIEEQRFYEITKLRVQFQNILESCKLSAATAATPPPKLSGMERAQRNGELRQLRALKRQRKYEEPRQRKVLKHSVGGDDEQDYAGATTDDLRDVEFRLQHDARQMAALQQSARADQRHDLLLLKLIIASGFYPQLALADEFNYCKGGAQQFFHTLLKPFLTVHPNAHFAKHYEVLRLSDSDLVPKPDYYTPKQPLSVRHQLLCYQSMLETSKPYLMNCIRLPAAQALLLFAHVIDTNLAMTRLVCDGWLCLELPTGADDGCQLLCRAIALRRRWHELLTQQLTALQGDTEVPVAVDAPDNAGTAGLQAQLWSALVDFMCVDVPYSIKRLLPADLKTLYTHRAPPNARHFALNPFAADYAVSVNAEKGGLNVAENVVYGCLQEQPWTLAMAAVVGAQQWRCQHCAHEIPSDPLAQLLHQQTCRQQQQPEDQQTVAAAATTTSTQPEQKQQQYRCAACGQTLNAANQIVLLKHKRFCKATLHNAAPHH